MKLLKNLTVSFVAALCLALPLTAHAQSKDIVDIAAGDHRFSTLVSLVKSAGLVDVLKGDGPFTLFAPTNAAFAKVSKSTLRQLQKDKKLLIQVLTYHVVPGKVTAAQVVKVRSAKTVEGKSLRVSVKHGKVKVDNAKVTATDIMARNGVIHVIDSVLIPSDLGHPAKSGHR